MANFWSGDRGMYSHSSSYFKLLFATMSSEDFQPSQQSHRTGKLASQCPHLTLWIWGSHSARIKNIYEPNTEPCRTPLVTGTRGENWSATRSLICLFFKKATTQFRKACELKWASSCTRSKRKFAHRRLSKGPEKLCWLRFLSSIYFNLC